MMTDKVLEIEGLQVAFLHDGKYQDAVKNVNFSVYRGRTLGIVGESGSGKSVSSMSVMGLLPSEPTCCVKGRIVYYENDSKPQAGSVWMDFGAWKEKIDGEEFEQVFNS